MKFSACIELLFAQEPHFPDRIRLAKQAGYGAVEFWKWTDKDVEAVGQALAETGLELVGIVAEPMIGLNEPQNKAAFLEGLARSAEMASRLNATILIAQAGDAVLGRERGSQRAALTDCLRSAAEVLNGTGVRLGLEPLNTLVDHQGYFLDSTAETLDIIDDVSSANIGIVYDLYHSLVMGERIEEVLDGRLEHVLHVHVADHPGRGSPGTGKADLNHRLSWLFQAGYDGYVGLEFRPGDNTPSEAAIRAEFIKPDAINA